ncbi:MAG: hypothetical protein K2M34_03600 [Alphaproteobacteria bacterium]|nr:hypothetical protein [Alphaproteobacteria bacterium]
MNTKAQNTETKRMCWLHGAHVVVSEYNNNGTCNCMDCHGTHCQNCPTYQAKVAEIVDICSPTICQQCLTHQGHSR